ncbi:MAG: glycine betaine ABC transporter substrate-binding protein [Myxococcales bacterium]
MTAVALAAAAALTLGAPVHVGSKSFAESRLLAELFAQAIEARGLRVERDFGLGGSEVAFAALRSGSLDVYPEYEGTALLVLLGEPLDPPGGGPRRVTERLREGLAVRGLTWLSPLGFSNGWVLAMPAALAQREGLASLSDLGRAVSRGLALAGGFSPEFLDRPDGLPALERAYGFRLGDARPLAQPLKYAAISAGKIGILDAYATDPELTARQLTPLADDRRFFPPYACAPLARADLAVRAPEAAAALLSLAGRIDLETMRRLNAAVAGGRPEAEVASSFLASLGLHRPPAAEAAGASAAAFFWRQRGYLGRLLVRHVELTLAALLAAAALGLFLGLLASRKPLAERWVLRSVSVAQTIPSLPLLAFLVPWLGIGVWPSLVALFLYALLPIAQATHAGLSSIDPDLLWIAAGQGMTERQILARVRVPLSLPVVLGGLRVATVATIGNATLAAFVGGGGLGEPILTGLTLNDTRLILLGAVPAALLAIAADALLAWLGRRLAPLR